MSTLCPSGCVGGDLVGRGVNDVAVITLTEDMDPTVGTALVDTSPLEGGQGVTVSGYGCEDAAHVTSDPRYYKSAPSTVISQVDALNVGNNAYITPRTALAYALTPGPSFGNITSTVTGGLCPGDSGGPLFRGFDNAGPDLIVGVNGSGSYFAGPITQLNFHSRINNGLADRSSTIVFLRNLLPATSFTGGSGFTRPELRDIDGDLRSDITWRNKDTGQLSTWLLNGAGFVIAHVETNWAAADSSGWKAVGTGDFNGDGQTDILWHNGGTGQVSVWFMDGQNATGTSLLQWGAQASSGWRIVGTGDFDGDGNTDVLWYHGVLGKLSIWYLNGMAVHDGAVNWTTVETTGWSPVGVGDFNNDGHPDIAWHQKDTGEVGIWYMNNATALSTGTLNWKATDASGWKIVSLGDYNQDGNLDILWHHGSSGKLSEWLLNGTTTVDHDAAVSWTTTSSSGWEVISR